MARIFATQTPFHPIRSSSTQHSLFSKGLSWWYSTGTQRRSVIQSPSHSFISSILSSAELLLVLRKFGKCNIKWPKHDGINHNMPGQFIFSFTTNYHLERRIGFCHVVFRESRSVSELLQHCIQQQQRSTIDYFLHIHITSATNRIKPVCNIISLSIGVLLSNVYRSKSYHGM